MNYTLQKDYPSHSKGTILIEKDGRYFSEDGILWFDKDVIESSEDFTPIVEFIEGEQVYVVTTDGNVKPIVFSKQGSIPDTYFKTEQAALEASTEILKIIKSAQKI